MKKMPTHSLRGLLQAAQSKIPAQIRMAAELRQLWQDIVGPTIAQKSQVAEYKYGDLLIWVDSPEWQTELTMLKGSILEKIPARFKVRDMRFVLLKNKNLAPKAKKKSQLSSFAPISDEERRAVQAQIAEKKLDTELSQTLYRFLCLCRTKKI